MHRDLTEVLAGIRTQVAQNAIRVTQHAHREMIDETIRLDDVLEAIESETAQILEDYPTHRRGACCLLYGKTKAGRPIHVVCTTSHPALIIITVYEPVPPKWVSPVKRGNR